MKNFNMLYRCNRFYIFLENCLLFFCWFILFTLSELVYNVFSRLRLPDMYSIVLRVRVIINPFIFNISAFIIKYDQGNRLNSSDYHDSQPFLCLVNLIVDDVLTFNCISKTFY